MAHHILLLISAEAVQASPSHHAPHMCYCTMHSTYVLADVSKTAVAPSSIPYHAELLMCPCSTCTTLWLGVVRQRKDQLSSLGCPSRPAALPRVASVTSVFEAE